MTHTHTHTHTHSRTPLDEWSARRRDLYLKQNFHRRPTSLPPAGFETATVESERRQTHALDRAASVIAYVDGGDVVVDDGDDCCESMLLSLLLLLLFLLLLLLLLLLFMYFSPNIFHLELRWTASPRFRHSGHGIFSKTCAERSKAVVFKTLTDCRCVGKYRFLLRHSDRHQYHCVIPLNDNGVNQV